MQQIHRPAADWELRTLLREAGSARQPVEIVGGATKRAIGRRGPELPLVSTLSLAGVTLYEPTELVMSARAGTPLATIEQELTKRGQMLAFEPIDIGPVLGAAAGQGTIGGVFATNLSGARRIMAGAARDHILGVTAVTGGGDLVKSGGRVMKNVTGVDVARGLMGSWGTLAVMTETTFSELPRASRPRPPSPSPACQTNSAWRRCALASARRSRSRAPCICRQGLLARAGCGRRTARGGRSDHGAQDREFPGLSNT